MLVDQKQHWYMRKGEVHYTVFVYAPLLYTPSRSATLEDAKTLSVYFSESKYPACSRHSLWFDPIPKVICLRVVASFLNAKDNQGNFRRPHLASRSVTLPLFCLAWSPSPLLYPAGFSVFLQGPLSLPYVFSCLFVSQCRTTGRGRAMLFLTSQYAYGSPFLHLTSSPLPLSEIRLFPAPFFLARILLTSLDKSMYRPQLCRQLAIS